MAKSNRVVPVRSKPVTASWLKNAMRGIGASTKNVVEQYAPNVSATLSAGKNSVQKIADSVNHRNINKNILAENKYVQIANKAFKNAITDLKTGNLAGDEKRVNKATCFKTKQFRRSLQTIYHFYRCHSQHRPDIPRIIKTVVSLS